MTDGRSPRAVVVTVGDELLLGKTVDRNAAWLGRRLTSLGIEVERRYTVGDDEADIRETTGRALSEGDVVLFTGGLGPTSDDLTRPVVADVLDAPLREDEELLRSLRRKFRDLGFEEMPESNRSQAELPEGAEVLPNPRGTAPGLLMEGPEGQVVVLMPGVPREMKGIFREHVEEALRRRFGDRLRPVRHRVIHTTGVSESELADRLEGALPPEMGPVRLAYLPDTTGVALRLTARDAESDEEAEGWLDRVEEAILGEVGRYVYESETGDLVEPVSRALEERGYMLATAESCTGGLIAKRVTDRPGSSRVFAGGVVAYSNEVKRDVLGIDPQVIERAGAVSEEVARAMAGGVAAALGCRCGIGVTGVAGPGGGTEAKPVGLVWYAAAVGDRVEARERRFPGDRSSVRERSAQAALALLLEMLRDE